MDKNPNHVYQVLQSGLARRDGGEGWTIFFGLLVSLCLSGALGFGIYALIARFNHWPLAPVGAILSVLITWAVGYLLGAVMGDQVGIADSAFQAASDMSYGLGTSSEVSTDFFLFGCATLAFQFLFGSLHKAVDYFIKGNGSSQALTLATVIVTLCLRQEQSLTEAEIIAQVRAARRSFRPNQISQAISLLKERGYLEGEGRMQVPPGRRAEF